jgi:hypothetical protein
VFDMTRPFKLLLFAPLAIIGFALFSFLGGYIVMRLWNWLTPNLWGWHTISFWQAFGLLVLCRILFGRIGGGIRPGRGGMWGRRMRRRFEHMTPEEKARFKEKVRERWGFLDAGNEREV